MIRSGYAYACTRTALGHEPKGRGAGVLFGRYEAAVTIIVSLFKLRKCGLRPRARGCALADSRMVHPQAQRSERRRQDEARWSESSESVYIPPCRRKPPQWQQLRGVHKATTASGHSLIGRRVSVPQRYTEVEDDGDGFCFGGTIESEDERRAVVRFDYTGERETYLRTLVRGWLSEADSTELLAAFSSSLKW